MSYANGTQFYNLPQTVGTDKRDWFDTNSAFAAVDAALHAAVTGQAADAEAISAINASLATDEADIAALQTASTSQAASISTLQTTVTTQATQIADVRQDAEDMITANNEGAAATSTRAYTVGDYFIYNDVLYMATESIAIGDTIVPNTNCSATNVDTEISEIKSDLTEGVVIATATADGIKTFAQILTELNTQVTNSGVTLSNNSVLRKGEEVYQIDYKTDRNFTRVEISAGESKTYIITLSLVNAKASTMAVGTAATTFTDNSSSVVTSGTVFTVYR